MHGNVTLNRFHNTMHGNLRFNVFHNAMHGNELSNVFHNAMHGNGISNILHNAMHCNVTSNAWSIEFNPPGFLCSILTFFHSKVLCRILHVWAVLAPLKWNPQCFSSIHKWLDNCNYAASYYLYIILNILSASLLLWLWNTLAIATIYIVIIYL